jgi:glycosyltransferase involved in cell wall biosynthesis
MSTIVFFVTSWGFENGGINSFNHDLCKATAELENRSLNVVCVVPHCSALVAKRARSMRIVIISLDRSAKANSFGANDAHATLELLPEHGVENIDWWVGHDVHTGPIAKTAKELSRKGKLALILHTKPLAYEVYKGDNRGPSAYSKYHHQEELVSSADVVFGVGPRLTAHAHEIQVANNVSNRVVELVPGLADIASSSLATGSAQFRGIAFGRVDSRTDRVKQGRLAVEAFAYMLSRQGNIFGPDPTFTIAGVGKRDASDIMRFAEVKAGRRILIHPLPYTSDRDRLYATLRSQSVSVMPSIHEGFGLSGWESIAAEIPLILSRNSGLFDLISTRLGGPGVGCVFPVDIRGNANSSNIKDIKAIGSALAAVAQDRSSARNNATALKKQLIALNLTWKSTADAFLDGLGLRELPPAAVPHASLAVVSLHQNDHTAVSRNTTKVQLAIARDISSTATRSIRTLSDKEVDKIRSYWSKRSDFLGKADAERDSRQESWIDDLFVESAMANRIIGGDARVVVGRKGSGKSATRIAASTLGSSREHVLTLAVSADEAFADQTISLASGAAFTPTAGTWYRAFAFHFLRSMLSELLSITTTKSIEDGILEWCTVTTFSERAFVSQVGDAARNLIPKLLQAQGINTGYEFARELNRPINFYIDDFDKLYKPGHRAKSIDTIRTALEAVDRLVLSANGPVVTILLREDLWLLCRGGWSYLDKMTDVVDLRWSEDMLKDWLVKRLRKAAAQAMGVSAANLSSISFDNLWRLFFPERIVLENGKDSLGFGYILRRTLYTPRDLYKFITRISEVTNQWPATNNSIIEAERNYANDRLEYLATEFGSLCDGLLSCLNSFSTKTMEIKASDLYKHLRGLISSGEVRLVDSLVEGESEVSLARFLFRIGFLEVRYPDGERWEVRDALRYPDHWKGIRRDDSVRWAVRSIFFRVLESHRRLTPVQRLERSIERKE